MLSLRLLPRCYIPIKPVDVLPREREQFEKERRRAKVFATRQQSALFRSLQNPLFSQESTFWKGFAVTHDEADADRSFTEESDGCAGETTIRAEGVGPEVDTTVNFETDSLDLPPSYTWTEADIVEMARGILTFSLKILCAKGNPTEKIDVLDWVFESEIADVRTVTGPYGAVKQVIYTRQCAFSFPMCCAVLNYDPAVFRSFLIHHLPQEAKRYFIYRHEAEPLLEDVRNSHQPKFFGC